MADTKRKRPAEVLSEAEVRSLLAQCSRRAPTVVRDHALLTVLYRASLCIEEALDLKPADVDQDRGTIRVLYGKGDHNRTVAIDDGALARRAALAHRARQARRRRPPAAVLHSAGRPAIRQPRCARWSSAAPPRPRSPRGFTTDSPSCARAHARRRARSEGVPVNVIQR